MTIFTHKNIGRDVLVVDVETQKPIGQVLEIDTDESTVMVAKMPIEYSVSGDLTIQKLRYRSIQPIYGLGHFPCLFHCYGRLHAFA